MSAAGAHNSAEPRIITAIPDWRWRGALYIAIYLILALLCLRTALVQANAAAVWMPSGFGAGILIVEGQSRWRAFAPLIGLASLAVNFATNTMAEPQAPIWLSLAVAASIGLGNMIEAVVAAALTERFAGGRQFIASTHKFVIFCLLVPAAAAISVGFGVGAVWAAGFGDSQHVSDTVVTWLIANVVGIILFGSLTTLVLLQGLQVAPVARWPEAALLGAGLVFFGQALNGIYLHGVMQQWPKPYMCIPLLLWAAMRFSAGGAVLSLLLITLMSVAGTMNGFLAFPADTPARSLIFLQVYIGMVATITLAVAVATTEVAELQAGLERKVRERTAQIEGLLADRELLTSLVIHDLQSPLYGVRNASTAAVRSLEAGVLDSRGIADVFKTIADTSEALARRVNDMLALAPANGEAPRGDQLMPAVRRVIAAHRLEIKAKSLSIQVTCDVDPAMSVPGDLEHILDVLIDNAIQHSPKQGEISVAVGGGAKGIEIIVADHGPGIDPARRRNLFDGAWSGPTKSGGDGSRGVGLRYARQRAERCGGSIALASNSNGTSGATFVIALPSNDCPA